MAIDKKNQNLKQRTASGEARQPRPPIVVVMGHVDHGKTTLLDYIRKTNIAAKEAGGITQSIGAYEITHQSQTNADYTQTDAEKVPRGSALSQRKSAPSEGRKITFIDTPGHEAFTKMRSRGANIADLAILVMAADEGVKPQTTESVKILQETKTPFVVAITKIDKPNADIEKVKNELTAAGVLLEGYGGQTSYQPVSAKTGEHVNELLDLILLAADLENLTYEPSAPASGFILETKLDQRRGLEAMAIVKNGILRHGDNIFTPTTKGKVKILENFLGKPAEELEPSAPALVIGFENQPQIGEEFSAMPVAAAEIKSLTQRETPASTEAQEKIFKIILKAADSGSLEALAEVLKSLAFGKSLKVIDSSVGNINDNDVKFAISAGATIIAFKSNVNKSSENFARLNNVKIISSGIIYELVKAVEELWNDMQNPEPLGVLEILAVFNQKNPQKQIVGGKATKGAFRNKANFEIERNGGIISAGKVLNLQQQKKDITEVGEGEEAGLLVSSETLIKTGDKLVIK